MVLMITWIDVLLFCVALYLRPLRVCHTRTRFLASSVLSHFPTSYRNASINVVPLKFKFGQRTLLLIDWERLGMLDLMSDPSTVDQCVRRAVKIFSLDRSNRQLVRFQR